MAAAACAGVKMNGAYSLARGGSCIFLVGPGGTGKSTLGPVLAAALGARFVDLDREVCERVLVIPDLVEQRGYAEYCRVNGQVAEELVAEHPDLAVMATSSGFLAHDDQPEAVRWNRRLIHRTGMAVLFLPSADDEESVRVITERQVQRYGVDTRQHWLRTTRRRIPAYRSRADEEIVAAGSPEASASRVIAALAGRGWLRSTSPQGEGGG
jgi:shikimate kinase